MLAKHTANATLELVGELWQPAQGPRELSESETYLAAGVQHNPAYSLYHILNIFQDVAPVPAA